VYATCSVNCFSPLAGIGCLSTRSAALRRPGHHWFQSPRGDWLSFYQTKNACFEQDVKVSVPSRGLVVFLPKGRISVAYSVWDGEVSVPSRGLVVFLLVLLGRVFGLRDLFQSPRGDWLSFYLAILPKCPPRKG
jgi:hypothetical protein